MCSLHSLSVHCGRLDEEASGIGRGRLTVCSGFEEDPEASIFSGGRGVTCELVSTVVGHNSKGGGKSGHIPGSGAAIAIMAIARAMNHEVCIVTCFVLVVYFR